MRRGNFVVALCVAIFCTIDAYDRPEIDEFFDSLDYNPNEVLVYQGEGVSSFQKREGKFEGPTFVVVTREKKTIQNGKADLGVIASNEHVTYPGNLFAANSDLLDNNPRILNFDRNPLEYVVNLPGLQGVDNGFKITPNYKEYKTALNGILKNWFENYPHDQDPAAMFHSDSSFAYSENQLAVKFGLEFTTSQMGSKIDFSAINKNQKTVMVHKFNQIYYTVSTILSTTPSRLFKDTVTVADLKRSIDEKSPPVIVDSVSYGRQIYVVIETSSTDNEAKSFMEANLSKIDLKTSNEVDYSSKLKDFNMYVAVVGGSSDQIKMVKAENLQDVADLIVKYGKFGRENLGVPLTYSTRFVKDLSRALVQSTAEYTEVNREEHKQGMVKLRHYGGYVAQWAVTWELVTYDEEGNEVITHDSWGRNYDDFTAPMEKDIELPGNARNINVMARGCTWLAWNWWNEIINRSNIPLLDSREFKISGTSLDMSHDIRPGI